MGLFGNNKKDKEAKNKILQYFKTIGIYYNITLPQTIKIKNSAITKMAAANVGGRKGLAMSQNERTRQLTITTHVKLTPQGVYMIKAGNNGHDLIMPYRDIAKVDLKRKGLDITTKGGLQFKFRTDMLIRAGIKRVDIDPKYVNEVFFEYITHDWKLF